MPKPPPIPVPDRILAGLAAELAAYLACPTTGGGDAIRATIKAEARRHRMNFADLWARVHRRATS
jgi:hypothetical protein